MEIMRVFRHLMNTIRDDSLCRPMRPAFFIPRSLALLRLNSVGPLKHDSSELDVFGKN
jgi:hypothetical protein